MNAIYIYKHKHKNGNSEHMHRKFCCVKIGYINFKFRFEML